MLFTNDVKSKEFEKFIFVNLILSMPIILIITGAKFKFVDATLEVTKPPEYKILVFEIIINFVVLLLI